MILIETTAGQGTALGRSFEEIAGILVGVEAKDRDRCLPGYLSHLRGRLRHPGRRYLCRDHDRHSTRSSG